MMRLIISDTEKKYFKINHFLIWIKTEGIAKLICHRQFEGTKSNGFLELSASSFLVPWNLTALTFILNK
jgi:hypothetical protein